jgi:hypothetical protein
MTQYASQLRDLILAPVRTSGRFLMKLWWMH